MLIRTSLILTCILHCLIRLSAQNNVADNYRIKLDAFKAMHPPAMVYFHFDKPSYFAGDSVYYKAYQIEDESWIPRHTPQFITCEILDKVNRKVVLTHEALIDNGIAIGAFKLPDDMTTGDYVFKADSYLMNFDAPNIDFLYSFYVKGKDTKITTQAKSQIHQNFVEGNNIVQGVLCRVVVKSDKDGFGKLVNEKGDSLASFIVNNGYGTLKFRPKNTDNLFTILHNEKIALPKVQQYGTVMTVDNIGSEFDLTVVLSAKLPEGVSEQKLTLMTDCNGKTGQYFDIFATNGKTIQVIPKATLRHGINRFLILDEKSNILNERLVYYHNPKLLFVSCEKVVQQINKQEDEVTLKFDVIDAAGNPVDAELSLSVVDSAFEVITERQDMVQSFTVNQQFAYPITDISVFFKNHKLINAKQFDLWVMTQQYGRYHWEDVKKYEYKPLDAYRIPYADERKAPKLSGFTAKNGLEFWQPSLKLLNGKGTVTFKTSHKKALHYKIVGFDRKGNITHIEF